MDKSDKSGKSSKKNLFVKRAPLSKTERKYCTCLVDVRGKGSYNPYGVCTNSVYISKGKRRNKFVNCEASYNYEKMSKDSLKELAKEKKLSIKKKGSNKEMASKSVLISRITKRNQERRSAYYKKLKSKLQNMKMRNNKMQNNKMQNNKI
jgi:hypothetical protein